MTYKNPIVSIENDIESEVNTKENVGIGECEFCAKDNVVVTTAGSFTEFYCYDCLKDLNKATSEAMKLIKAYEKQHKISRSKKKNIKDLEREANEALLSLTNGQIDLNGYKNN